MEQTTKGQNSDSSEESDTVHDQRRLTLPFYDAVSDPEVLRQVMDPFHSETGKTTPAKHNYWNYFLQ